MGEREGNRKYDYETKLAAVLDHPERGMSGPEAMECHGIASRHPDMAQQQRLLAMLEEKLPEGADPILHSDMGWQYQHDWWRNRLGELNIRQSMSRKGNCIDNAATEQVFGHLKDEFYRGREFASYEEFEAGLGRVHGPLEHQTPPDTTGGTYLGGISEHVPHSLIRHP